MADERFDGREGPLRTLGTWTLLFRGFQVALDWKKLLLAAGGILTMACAWWLLAMIFGRGAKPTWPSDYEKTYREKNESPETALKKGWEDFRRDRRQWNLRHEASGLPDAAEYTDTGDVANTPQEYEEINSRVLEAMKKAETTRQPQLLVLKDRTVVIDRKPSGKLRTWPFFEDRGPNPYLMVTGQAGRPDADGTPRYAPWDRGHFFDWFTTQQLPVLLEPLAKFARPVFYLLKPDAGIRNQTYFFLVIVATLAIWAFFGGAITRMAAVQLARKEKISLGEAVRFACNQWKSFLFASVAPLLLVGFVVLCTILFGFFLMIPVLGDIVGGLLAFLLLIAGIVMAMILVGYLVGWPLIQATISTEGSDSFDALSRTYSYVFQSPWNYLRYAATALVYGAVVVFFVGFMGSLMVYLGKWGVSQTPGNELANREPSYLFVYTPTSFQWRELLLQGATVEGARVVEHSEIQWPVYDRYLSKFNWWNHVGAVLVAVWVGLLFLMVIGFGYSFFWSASTIIYFLMRHQVDDTDLDEVYLEEEDVEDVYTPPAPTEAPAAKPGTTPLAMVEAPALRPTPPPAAATSAPDGDAAGTTNP